MREIEEEQALGTRFPSFEHHLLGPLREVLDAVKGEMMSQQMEMRKGLVDSEHVRR